jgi:hypothetical protein
MRATPTTTTELVKEIDRQLKVILSTDIRKIDDIHIRGAVFLQLIAA